MSEREELAKEYSTKRWGWSTQWHVDMAEGCEVDFLAGFDAALATHREELERLLALFAQIRNKTIVWRNGDEHALIRLAHELACQALTPADDKSTERGGGV